MKVDYWSESKADFKESEHEEQLECAFSENGMHFPLNGDPFGIQRETLHEFLEIV